MEGPSSDPPVTQDTPTVGEETEKVQQVEEEKVSTIKEELFEVPAISFGYSHPSLFFLQAPKSFFERELADVTNHQQETPDLELPDNVTVLNTPYGRKYIIGTAHVSQKSVEQVRELINKIKPHSVMVELCKNRLPMLFQSDSNTSSSQQHALHHQPPQETSSTVASTSQEIEDNSSDASSSTSPNSTPSVSDVAPNSTIEPQGSSDESTTSTNATPTNVGATNNATSTNAPTNSSANNATTAASSDSNETVRRDAPNATGGILQVLISNMYDRVAKKLKILPGGEFRAAFQEARKLNALVVLGDRPVDISLRRAWAQLSLSEQLQLVFHFLSSLNIDITDEDIEKMKSSDLITEMIRELGEQFPSFLECILYERDRYLTATLKMCPGNTVAIVGLGHVQGIKDNWDKKLSPFELLQIPQEPPLKKFAFKLAFLLIPLLFGVLTYLTYTNFPLPIPLTVFLFLCIYTLYRELFTDSTSELLLIMERQAKENKKDKDAKKLQ